MSPIDLPITEAAPENKSFVETIARSVCEKGLEFERTLMALNTDDNGKKFSFLWNSDPRHAFYQQKRNEYLKAAQKNQEDIQPDEYLKAAQKNQEDIQPDDAPATHDSCVPDDDDIDVNKFPLPSIPWIHINCDPTSIPLKELGIIKLTAQFFARYGTYFLQGLRKRVDNKPQFEFLKPTDSRFEFLCGLFRTYSTVLRPCRDTMMMAAPEGVFEVYFYHLQLEKLEKGDVMAMIDLHALVSGVDHFARMERGTYRSLPTPERLSGMMLRCTEMQPPPRVSKQLTAKGGFVRPPPNIGFDFGYHIYRLFEKQITLNELGIIKLTAQFVARYGKYFHQHLMECVVMNPLFEFLKPTDCSSSRSRFFTFILEYYSNVLEPSQWMWKGDGITTLTALEHFSYCLQLEELEDGVEMATVDLHALVGGVDCFTHLNRETFSFYVPQPEHLSTLMGSQIRRALIHQGCVAGDDNNAQLSLLPFTRLDKTNCGFPSDKSPPSLSYHNLTFRVPAKGITLNELGIMMLTAQFEGRYGIYFERALMGKVIMNRQFGFIKGTDRRNGFYKGLAYEYDRILRSPEDEDMSDACVATVLDGFFRLLKRDGEEEGFGLLPSLGVIDCFAHMDDEEYSVVMPPPVHVLMNMIPKTLWRPGTIVLPPPVRSVSDDYRPDSYDDRQLGDHPCRDTPIRPDTTFCRRMLGFTLEELSIIKVTAQFEVRYGKYFMQALMTRVAEKKAQQFKFMEPTGGRRFDFYRDLVKVYSRILRPCNKVDVDTVLQGYFRCVDHFQQKDLRFSPLGGVVGLADWFAYYMDDADIIPPNFYLTSDYFHRAYDKRPPPLMRQPEEPEPKRQKFDGESALSPKDEFLARHAASSRMIKIFVQDIGEVDIITENRSKSPAKS